jgi:hypothetical protein
MNALLKPGRRNRLNVSPYRDEIVLRQRQENAFCTIRPGPPITLSAANKPFAETINLTKQSSAARAFNRFGGGH